MNLKLFFQLPKAENDLLPSALGTSILSLANENIDLAKVDLALIGITENRGTEENYGVSEAAESIRKALYRLKKSKSNYRIIDLGNLQNGENLEDTHDRLREVCEFLMAQKILPVILGGTHDLSLAQYRAFETSHDLISVLNVDAKMDVEVKGASNQTFLTKLITHKPNFLFSYNHLAHQEFLVEAGALTAMNQLYFEALRLGELRENFEKAEPIIRMANMLAFDIGAIRSADAPANIEAQPFGLTGEEACRIMWYAGLNERMKSISISEYNPALDEGQNRTAKVIAAMVWYFIEGYYQRKDTGEFNSSAYVKYTVSFEGTDDTLTFFKSKKSEKWWILVQHGEGFRDRAYIPCSYEDYTEATHGDFPERWIKAQGKLV